jgi:hypothetical protein
MDAYEYWRDIALRSRADVAAACQAVGAAGYYLGPYCHYSDAERLERLRDVISDLRTALNLTETDITPAKPVEQQPVKGREQE